MNYTVFYSPEAEQDLVEILVYGIEVWVAINRRDVFKNYQPIRNIIFFPLSYQAKTFEYERKVDY